MAYIGKEPIVGNFQKCDAITVVNGQAAYTLQVSSTNVVPESANHMLVSLNGILQAPITSFSVSSSTLTFVSNLATGDVIDFVILLGNVLDIGTPSDATVTNAKLAQDIISGETELAVAPADTDEFLVSDAGTIKRIDYSLVKHTNTPAFRAKLSSDQACANNAATLVAFATEDFDTDSAFTNTASNYKFTVPSGKDGKYCFSVHVRAAGFTSARENVSVRKNGSEIFGFENGNGSVYDSMGGSFILDLSATDYIDATFYHNQGGSQNILAESYFSGFKLIT